MTLVLYLVYLRHQKLKRIERRMRLQSINDESYRMIMEHTNDIIFEYDTLEKTYLHTANFKKTFGYEPSKSGFLGSLEYDYIHPEDVVPFVTMFEGMSKENALTEAEVRIVNAEGEYLWTRIYTLGIFDKDGKPAKIIGKIININEEKRELEQLQEKAVMDFSSGVLNKQTTEQMIRSFLSGEGKLGRHALFIVDIDDFKGINDDYGHRLGDAVISALGCELNQIFRNSDIKGRIGGDEFMILMKDIEDTESIAQKASAICSTFHRREVEPGRQIPLSTSIGIALYDGDGSSFEELYEAADQALYNCKNIEKGTFTFWEDNPAQ
jgi:diguanylate cyclase (GGDEF)-like protein/PAS domain S-box-containing protein